MAEQHELKLIVSVDKKTGEMTVVNAELNEVKKSTEELQAATEKGAKATENATQKTVGWRQAMKVLLPAFSTAVIANFFKTAAMEAAKYDKEASKALKDSSRMWDNLKITIGEGFLPVIKLVPAVVESLIGGFLRLRQAVETAMGVVASLFSKHIKASEEIAAADEKRKKAMAELIAGEKKTSEESIKEREKLLERIEQLSKDEFDFKLSQLNKEKARLEQMNVDKAAVEKWYSLESQKIAKERQAAKDKINKEIEEAEQKAFEEANEAYEDAISERERLDEEYATLKTFLSEDGLQKELLKIEEEKAAKLQLNAVLLADDQSRVDQSLEITRWAENERAKVIEKALQKKYNLEKWSSSAIDVLTAGSEEKQKAAVWEIVRQEALGHAKRQALAAATALATGNFAQAAIAAAQIAVSVGVANFAQGERQKIEAEAEARRVREEERLREDERRVRAAEEAAAQEQAITDNKTQYEYEKGQMSVADYIAFLKQKQSAHKEYTSEWLSIQRQIEKAEEDRTSAIREQSKEATKLRGEIKGAAVKTEQRQVYNTYNINLNVSAMDLRAIEDRHIRDIAIKLLPYLKKEETR